MTSDIMLEKAKRLGGLWRFAMAITAFNILGHAVFGFEQSWAQPVVALITAYAVELLLESVDAWAAGRRPGFLGGPKRAVGFLLSAHITGLAVAMLIYTNDRLWPTVFGVAVAIGSKAIFRAPVGGRSCHFLNPSNFGITVVLLVFPSVGAAPPYHFTENLAGAGDWILPGLIVVSGTFINWRFTGKLPVVAGWLIGFALQAVIRSVIFDTPAIASLLPMTGLAFILYTFYMVTDPATTPAGKTAQFAFGLSVAAVYALLMLSHIVFGLFFALTAVSAMRGLGLYIQAALAQRSRVEIPAQAAIGER
jgi:hypothetical protein